MFTEDQRIGYIVEANKRALASNGTSDVTAELRKMAQAANMPLDEAERMMGYQPGVLTGGSAQPAQQANLGMGTQPASSVTPLSAADRDSWRARFDSQAAASGKSAGQHMYEYAQQNGLSNADVDTYMGYNPGTAQSWVQQNISGAAPQATIAGNNTPTTAIGPYQSANLGMGGGAAGGGAGGGSSPQPSAPPTGGTYNPSTNTTTGRDIMGPGWQATGGGSSNLGFNTQYPGVNNANPYLAGMGRDIGNQLADTWQRRMLPSIRSGAMAAGGFGGSRQGVVEANALNDLGKNYVSGLTNLYGTDYTNAQNRGLQQRGMDQSYDLGLRNNDLGFSNLDYQINQGNFSNNLAAANFGLGVQNQLNNNNLAGIGAGTNIQNTQLDYQKYYNDAVKGYGNAGGTRNGTTTT